MKLIDAEKLEKVLKDYYKPDYKLPYGGLSADAIAAMSAIDNAQMVDVEQVRHGQWQWKEQEWLGRKITSAYCTACKRTMNPNHYGLPHCPHCGAIMDGGNKRAAD